MRWVVALSSSLLPVFAADPVPDVVKRLQERSESIRTAELTCHVASVRGLGEEKSAEIWRSVCSTRLGKGSAYQEGVSLLLKESGVQKPVWSKHVSAEDREYFKYSVWVDGEQTSMQHYDRGRYIFYYPTSAQKQLDVYSDPETRAMQRWDPRSLSLFLRDLLQYPVGEKAALPAGGYMFTAVISDGGGGRGRKVARVEMNRVLELQRIVVTKGGEVFHESLYHYASEDGRPAEGRNASFPVGVTRFRHAGNHSTLRFISIEKFAVNQDVPSENLEMPSVPPWGVVVDHRPVPETVCRWSESSVDLRGLPVPSPLDDTGDMAGGTRGVASLALEGTNPPVASEGTHVPANEGIPRRAATEPPPSEATAEARSRPESLVVVALLGTASLLLLARRYFLGRKGDGTPGGESIG